MKRIILLLAVAAMLAVILVVTAGPAMAKSCGISCGEPVKPVKTGDKETDQANKEAYKEQRKSGCIIC